MVIDEKVLNDLSEQAKQNPRLRIAMDLRNSPDDDSQRMLNALEPGTKLSIHRHRFSSETAICIRGHYEEYFYDEKGNLTEVIDMVPGKVLNVPIGQWHNVKCLESNTVIFECKNGKWEPMGPEDILQM